MSASSSTATSRVAVTIAPDRSRATLSISTPPGRRPITEDEVLAAILEADVPVDKSVNQRVAEFVQLAQDGGPCSEFVVAEGRPARHAQDETFVWNNSFQQTHAEWQDDTAVNYYTLHAIVTVDKDAVIGTLSPPVTPQAGKDLWHNAIPAEGTPASLALDKTVRRASDDSQTIIANVPGRVVEEDGTLRIEEVLRIEGDVGFDSGNVDSNVSVHVSGSVPDRFEVKSDGSITVGGTIEAATVTAGGNVVVRRGILGRCVGLVTAGGEITAKFCSDANLVAGEDVKIGKQLMNCHVCGGRGLLAAGANIIGGCILIRDSVETAHLGSDANVLTRMAVGVAPGVIRRIACIERRVGRVRELAEQIQVTLQPLVEAETALRDGAKERVDRLLAMADDAKATIAKDEARRKELLEDVYVGDEARIRVSGTINSNVRVQIGDRETLFHNPLKGPVSVERRKIKNVTEIVAVNMLSGSVKVLKSERRSAEELLDGFELEAEPSGGHGR